MSFFDDQEDAWFDNNCQGDPCEYNPYGEPGELLEFPPNVKRPAIKAKTAASDEHKGASL